MSSEDRESHLVYAYYKGETYARIPIVDADLQSCDFITTGSLEIGCVYVRCEIIEVISDATHCLKRSDRVCFYRLKLEGEVIYNGDTFGKPFVTEAQAKKEGFKIFAHLIIGWRYKGKDIEMIRTKSACYYGDGWNVYFYIRE
jgi:hypothetical protein